MKLFFPSSAWGVLAAWAAVLPACTLQDHNLSPGVVETSPPTSGRSGARPLPPPSPPGEGPGGAGGSPFGQDGAAATSSVGAPDGAGGTGGSAGRDAPTAMGGAGAPDTAIDRMPIPPAFAVVEVATWKGGATGAYSIIHGSVCDFSAPGNLVHPDPELTQRGLRAGFSVIVGSCGQAPGGQWPKVKALADHGHDIVNHSFSFACLGGPQSCGGGRRASNDFAFEIDQSSQILETATGASVRFFAFPFDICGTAAVAHLRQRGYLGARCGGRGVSEPRFPDGFASKFDTWGPSFSIYGASGPCTGLVRPNANVPPETLPPACRAYVLNQYVDDAIAGNGWAIRTLTSFVGDPGAFQPISLPDYTAHLDYIKTRADAGQLWVEGPTPVLRYRWAREKCPLPAVEGNILRFPPPSAECQPYATTLSYVVTATSADPPGALKVTQAGTTQPAKTVSRGRYLINADPTRGDATLTP